MTLIRQMEEQSQRLEALQKFIPYPPYTKESKLSDESCALIYKGSQRLNAAPPSNRVLQRSNWPGQRREKRWYPGPVQVLLSAGFLAFLSVIFLLLMQDIHPAPTKLTLQKDAAELARLETQLRVGDSRIETRSLPSAAIPNAGTERVDTQPEKHSEFEGPKPTLITNRMSSVGRTREADSGEGHPRPLRRDLEGRTNYVRSLQSQRPIASTGQPNKQQGLGSFFGAVGRALGFSTRRDPL